MSEQGDYDMGWEYASTRSQVETDKEVIAMDCGVQGAEAFADDEGLIDQERLKAFGEGVLDFLHERPHREA